MPLTLLYMYYLSTLVTLFYASHFGPLSLQIFYKNTFIIFIIKYINSVLFYLLVQPVCCTYFVSSITCTSLHSVLSKPIFCLVYIYISE